MITLLFFFIFAVLVVRVHHVVLTPTFKLLSFYIYICCFMVVGRGCYMQANCTNFVFKCCYRDEFHLHSYMYIR